MLLERAADLAARIRQHQKIKSAVDEAEQFRTRATQLETASDLISLARGTLGKFADSDIKVDFVPNGATGYAAKAATLRAAILKTPGAINDPPFDLKHDFIDRLIGIASATDRATAKAWKAFVEKSVGTHV